MKSRWHKYIEKNQEFMCECDRGGKVYLGLHWVRYINITILVSLICLNVWYFFEPENFGSLLLIDSLFALACVYGYFQMYRDMRKNGHDSACSRSASFRVLIYSGRGSAYTISPPRKSKVARRVY